MKDLPVLIGTKLHFEDASPIECDSDDWFQFLKRGIGFRFLPAQDRGILLRNIILRCNIRAGKHYWYALRKANNRVRQEYVGTSEKLDYEHLVDLAVKLSLEESEYWLLKIQEKKQRTASKKYLMKDFSKELSIAVNRINECYDGYTKNDASLLIADVLYLFNKINN
jgi:hypothetical protein